MRKNPQDRGLGLETGVTGSPFPPHQAGGQRTLGSTCSRPRQTLEHLFGPYLWKRVPPTRRFGPFAADNFSEINKPVWIKQEPT